MRNATDNPKKKFESYGKSPLGILLKDFLNSLKKIKKTYPDNNEHSIENHRAFILIQLIEVVTDLAHNTFLPLFNKGGVPSSLGLASLGPGLLIRYKLSIAPLIQLISPEERFYVNLIQCCSHLLADNGGQQMLDFETIKRQLEVQKKALFAFEDSSEDSSTPPEKLLTPQEKKTLLETGLKQIEALQQLDGDVYRVDIALLPMHLIFERIPKHLISYALLEELTTLFQKLPENFNELVPFLTPQCVPKLLLETRLLKNDSIEDVQILSHERYRYKIINKKGEYDLSSDETSGEEVDFSESYFLAKSVISFVLSLSRRYYLSKLAEKDGLKENRMALFQAIELEEAVKNKLLEQQVMQKRQEMEQEFNVIVESLPELCLPCSIETIKVYLTVYVQLLAYIKKHEDETLKQFPPITLVGEITELKPFVIFDILSAMIGEAQKQKNKILGFIKDNFEQKYNVDHRGFDLRENDTLERIHAKIVYNRKKLKELTVLQENARQDSGVIREHLGTLNVNKKEYRKIDDTCFWVLNPETYEASKSHLKSDLVSLTLKYQFLKQLSALDPSTIKGEIDAIEKQIAQFRCLAAPNEKTIYKSTITPTSSVSGGISRTLTRTFKSMRGALSRSVSNNASSAVQLPEENNGGLVAENASEEKSAERIFQILQDQHKALQQLYCSSLVLEQFNQQLKAVSSNDLPTISQLDLINEALLKLPEEIAVIDSTEHRQLLVSLGQQHLSLQDSIEHSHVLECLRQQYRSLSGRREHILESLKQRHQVSMEKLTALIHETLMARYTRLYWKHTRILRKYSDLRSDMSQKAVDTFSQQLKRLSDKVRRFERNYAKFQKDFCPYLTHPLLAESLQSTFPPLVLTFSAETLQAMEPRQKLLAQRLQLLMAATPSSNRYLMSQLQTQLHHYIETGNNLEAIIQWMQVKQPSVRDVRFKTIWHQMHVGFWDEKYNAKAYDVNDLSANINRLKETNAPYAQSLDSLYQMLQSMRQMPHRDGYEEDSIPIFIDACMQDLAMLVDNKIPFDDFQKKLLTRLHSQDELMQRKNTQEMWRYWVANILIGLLTAGIALAAQWTYTRVSQGRGTLFFDKTQKEQCIQNMERHLHSFMQP